jgi:hypothetical protein
VGEKEKYFHTSSNKLKGRWFGRKRKEIKYTQQKAFPFSLAANWYQAFQTNIPGKKEDWNLSVVYSF